MILEGDMHRAVSGFALFTGFISLGYLGIHYKKINYKGGAPTIIGTLFLFLGVLSLILNIEEYGIAKLTSEWTGLFFEAFLITFGLFLLRSGRKIHALKTLVGCSSDKQAKNA
jgi:hypothetical protein